MARPTKKTPVRGPRRAGAVLVALTAEERDELRAAAAREGLTLIPWLRALGLRRARAPYPAPCPECGALTGESYRGHKAGCSRAMLPSTPARPPA